MRTLPAVGLAVMLMVSGAGGKQTNKPDLKLMASLDTAAPERLDASCLDRHIPAPFFVSMTGPAP